MQGTQYGAVQTDMSEPILTFHVKHIYPSNTRKILLRIAHFLVIRPGNYPSF